MTQVTIHQSHEQGVFMWDVESEDYPRMAPRYARLETVLGLLGARARDWERSYVVTVFKPGVPVQVHTFEGDQMQKRPPVEWMKTA